LQKPSNQQINRLLIALHMIDLLGANGAK